VIEFRKAAEESALSENEISPPDALQTRAARRENVLKTCFPGQNRRTLTASSQSHWYLVVIPMAENAILPLG
jgi:hypothetical protein